MMYYHWPVILLCFQQMWQQRQFCLCFAGQYCPRVVKVLHGVFLVASYSVMYSAFVVLQQQICPCVGQCYLCCVTKGQLCCCVISIFGNYCSFVFSTRSCYQYLSYQYIAVLVQVNVIHAVLPRASYVVVLSAFAVTTVTLFSALGHVISICHNSTLLFMRWSMFLCCVTKHQLSCRVISICGTNSSFACVLQLVMLSGFVVTAVTFALFLQP